MNSHLNQQLRKFHEFIRENFISEQDEFSLTFKGDEIRVYTPLLMRDQTDAYSPDENFLVIGDDYGPYMICLNIETGKILKFPFIGGPEDAYNIAESLDDFMIKINA